MRFRLRAIFTAWALRRSPPARVTTLSQKRIYILPTKAGVAFLLVPILLLLLAINYENDLVYAVCFLFVGLFLAGILHTYGNLAGMTITGLTTTSCFAGENAGFTIQLLAPPGREYEQLKLGWLDGPRIELSRLNGGSRNLEIPSPTSLRGWHRPGPLQIETIYPLGLFRAWTWIGLNLAALIYPAPIADQHPPFGAGGEGSGNLHQREGHDDFQGLRRYQPGTPLRQVAWKTYARGQGLHAKQFAGEQSRSFWLDWESWPGIEQEERLGRICHWVLALSADEQTFGLRLPSQTLAPAKGEQHRDQALRLLALYGKESVASG